MNWFQQWKLRREIRRDLIALRRENRHLSDAEFADMAEQFVRDEYEGVDPDNLKLILNFLRELLPIILELLPLLIVLLLSMTIIPQATGSDFTQTVATTKHNGPGCEFPVAAVKVDRKLPVWLDAQYASPDWTYPGSIYTHLFEQPHYGMLKSAGYTDRQLRSISVREAELLHNHLHNFESRQQVRQPLYSSAGT